jgi:hypothetical protein
LEIPSKRKVFFFLSNVSIYKRSKITTLEPIGNQNIKQKMKQKEQAPETKERTWDKTTDG